MVTCQYEDDSSKKESRVRWIALVAGRGLTEEVIKGATRPCELRWKEVKDRQTPSDLWTNSL